jgi:ribose 5-phosphate isomerase B
MKIAVGSDERTALTDVVIEELQKRGHKVELYGPLVGEALAWPAVGQAVALEILDA